MKTQSIALVDVENVGSLWTQHKNSFDKIYLFLGVNQTKNTIELDSLENITVFEPKVSRKKCIRLCY